MHIKISKNHQVGGESIARVCQDMLKGTEKAAIPGPRERYVLMIHTLYHLIYSAIHAASKLDVTGIYFLS